MKKKRGLYLLVFFNMVVLFFITSTNWFAAYMSNIQSTLATGSAMWGIYNLLLYMLTFLTFLALLMMVKSIFSCSKEQKGLRKILDLACCLSYIIVGLALLRRLMLYDLGQLWLVLFLTIIVALYWLKNTKSVTAT